MTMIHRSFGDFYFAREVGWVGVQLRNHVHSIAASNTPQRKWGKCPNVFALLHSCGNYDDIETQTPDSRTGLDACVLMQQPAYPRIKIHVN
eukprot:494480-Amphidinium_carterae.1